MTYLNEDNFHSLLKEDGNVSFVISLENWGSETLLWSRNKPTPEFTPKSGVQNVHNFMINEALDIDQKTRNVCERSSSRGSAKTRRICLNSSLSLYLSHQQICSTPLSGCPKSDHCSLTPQLPSWSRLHNLP